MNDHHSTYDLTQPNAINSTYLNSNPIIIDPIKPKTTPLEKSNDSSKFFVLLGQNKEIVLSYSERNKSYSLRKFDKKTKKILLMMSLHVNQLPEKDPFRFFLCFLKEYLEEDEKDELTENS